MNWDGSLFYMSPDSDGTITVVSRIAVNWTGFYDPPHRSLDTAAMVRLQPALGRSLETVGTFCLH